MGHSFRDRKENIELNEDDENTAPELEKVFETEWRIHISNMALQAVKDNFTPAVWEIYSRIARGELAENIASDTGLSRGTVYVYKERVQKSLRREIRRLNRELG